MRAVCWDGCAGGLETPSILPHRVSSCTPPCPHDAPSQDAFFKQLRTAPDGFSVVAEYFGRGLLNNTSVSTG